MFSDREFQSTIILELNECFLCSFLEKCLAVSSGVLHCRGSEKEGLVKMVNLLIYLINLDHVTSSSSVSFQAVFIWLVFQGGC